MSLEVVVHPPAEDMGAVNVAQAEVAEEGTVRIATTAVKTQMATGEVMVPELEVRKAPRIERGPLGNPTRGEAVVVGIVTASLVMILRGHLEGTMSAIAAQAVDMR